MHISPKLTASTLVLCWAFNLSAQQIGHTTVTYADPSRGNRQIQTEVYYPATVAGNNTPVFPGVFPLILCGHGFVMTWNAYENIWTALVPEGYIVAFPTTESGFSPVHLDLGLDLKYLVSAIQNNGAGTSVPASSVGTTSAVMGHSMGGGASFLAAAGNNSISTLVTFAAANTNPSSVTAALQVSVPTLLFSGTNDCVTPPAQHQDLMYDSTGAGYKTQIYISGGGHCYFADYNFNCALGEATCSPSPSITRAEQQQITSSFLKLWLAFYLKGDSTKAQEFQDSLVAGTGITYRQNKTIASSTGISKDHASENGFSVFPNPSEGKISLVSKYEPIRKIEVYHMDGKKLKEFAFQNESMTEAIDISDLPKGWYILKINNHFIKVQTSGW